MMAGKTSSRMNFYLLIGICVFALCFVACGCPKKKQLPPPSKKNADKKNAIKPLGKPDDVLICRIDQPLGRAAAGSNPRRHGQCN